MVLQSVFSYPCSFPLSTDRLRDCCPGECLGVDDCAIAKSHSSVDGAAGPECYALVGFDADALAIVEHVALTEGSEDDVVSALGFSGGTVLELGVVDVGVEDDSVAEESVVQTVHDNGAVGVIGERYDLAEEVGD